MKTQFEKIYVLSLITNKDRQNLLSINLINLELI